MTITAKSASPLETSKTAQLGHKSQVGDNSHAAHTSDVRNVGINVTYIDNSQIDGMSVLNKTSYYAPSAPIDVVSVRFCIMSSLA